MVDLLTESGFLRFDLVLRDTNLISASAKATKTKVLYFVFRVSFLFAI